MLIESSGYSQRPRYLINGHLETIVPSIFFTAPDFSYQRERIELSDGDFLDLDWLTHSSSENLMVISHGLEGSSHRHYIKRMAHHFYQLGWDVLAWNCRSCSGEMNRLPRFYHHGDTDDLASVIDYAMDKKDYQRLVLQGVSMGGSMSIKYAGEVRNRPKQLCAVVTFSVPCNLKDSALQLEKRSNRFYERRFVGKLIEKLKLKSEVHHDLDVEGIEKIQTFDEFHKRFTIPIHGFDSIESFYLTATCDQFLDKVEVPVLIVNALNDPLLGKGCYPFELISPLEYVLLETPRFGGHVGFTCRYDHSSSYMELRTESYLTDLGLL